MAPNVQKFVNCKSAPKTNPIAKPVSNSQTLVHSRMNARKDVIGCLIRRVFELPYPVRVFAMAVRVNRFCYGAGRD